MPNPSLLAMEEEWKKAETEKAALEKVYDRGIDINEGNGLQGRQKWYDFTLARQKLLNDNIQYLFIY